MYFYVLHYSVVLVSSMHLQEVGRPYEWTADHLVEISLCNSTHYSVVLVSNALSSGRPVKEVDGRPLCCRLSLCTSTHYSLVLLLGWSVFLKVIPLHARLNR